MLLLELMVGLTLELGFTDELLHTEDVRLVWLDEGGAELGLMLLLLTAEDVLLP